MNALWLKKIFRPIYVPLIEKLRFLKIQKQYPIHVMSARQTIKYIKKNGCSISRYGDGEFHTMVNSRDLGFQTYSESLAEDLKGAITGADERVLICFPRCIVSTVGMKTFSAKYWRSWGINNSTRIKIYQFVESNKKDYIFGDAMLTRPYIDWKSRLRAKIIFSELKTIWKDRHILIVEGNQTRLGIGNDLFSGAKSIKRILAPALNAYASYASIKNVILQNYNNELVILALGPTATVLAADLSKHGIQALDLGHVDIEYEWFLRNSVKKEAIPGKYTNEVYEGHVFSLCDDEEYQTQIIACIDC